jgi:hypothetical protein
VTTIFLPLPGQRPDKKLPAPASEPAFVVARYRRPVQPARAATATQATALERGTIIAVSVLRPAVIAPWSINRATAADAMISVFALHEWIR